MEAITSGIKLVFYRLLFVFPVGIFGIEILHRLFFASPFLIEIYFDPYVKFRIEKWLDYDLFVFIYIAIAIVIGEMFCALGDICLSKLFFDLTIKSRRRIANQEIVDIQEKIYPCYSGRLSVLFPFLSNGRNNGRLALELAEVFYSLSRMWAGFFLGFFWLSLIYSIWGWVIVLLLILVVAGIISILWTYSKWIVLVIICLIFPLILKISSPEVLPTTYSYLHFAIIVICLLITLFLFLWNRTCANIFLNAIRENNTENEGGRRSENNFVQR